MRRYWLVTLGCAKNQVDSGRLERALLARGWAPAEDPSGAEVLVVNTCGFITPAKQESIDTVLELAAVKAANPGARLVVAGCFAQRNAAELAAELPEVDAFFGVDAAELLPERIDALAAGAPAAVGGAAPRIHVRGAAELASAAYRPDSAWSDAAGPGAAYLKIAEGCDNRCAYCAIPLIRGGYRARPLADIVAEARVLAERGILELNLVSQDTSRWRDPENPKLGLAHLLDALEAVEGPAWIRPLYLHPAHVDAALVARIGAGGKVVPYFDLPVQHLSDGMLAAMGRPTDYAAIAALVERVRGLPRDAALRTSVIVGFPGETDGDVDLLLERMAVLRFDKLGCFEYSEEAGTPAAGRPGAAGAPVARRRRDRVMRLQAKLSGERLARHVGRELPVLLEERIEDGEGGDLWIGRSPYDAPDVDGNVVVRAPAGRAAADRAPAPGTIVTVRIDRATDYDLNGEVR